MKSASEPASDSDSEEREEEVVSHLQRLQGLAGSWRRHNKRPRLGREYREGPAGHQEEDDVPKAAAMQVYVHGINETGLQSALEKTSLWHRIELNNNLEVGLLLFCLQCQACVFGPVRHVVQPLVVATAGSVKMCMIVGCKDSLYKDSLYKAVIEKLP